MMMMTNPMMMMMVVWDDCDIRTLGGFGTNWEGKPTPAKTRDKSRQIAFATKQNVNAIYIDVSLFKGVSLSLISTLFYY